VRRRRCAHQWTVLDKGAGVAEVVDIFASSALSGLAPARDCVGSRRVESKRVTIDHLSEVGTDAIQIYLASLGLVRRLDVRLLDEGQRMSFEDRVSFGNRDEPHDSTLVGDDDVLHFHRFHHKQLLPAMHAVAFAHVDGNDRALHRRFDRHRIFRRGDVVSLRRHDSSGRRNRRDCIALRFAVMENRQRIARVDLCSSSTTAGLFDACPGSRRRAIEEEPPMPRFRAGDQRRDVVVDEASINAIRDELRML